MLATVFLLTAALFQLVLGPILTFYLLDKNGLVEEMRKPWTVILKNRIKLILIGVSVPFLCCSVLTFVIFCVGDSEVSTWLLALSSSVDDESPKWVGKVAVVSASFWLVIALLIQVRFMEFGGVHCLLEETTSLERKVVGKELKVAEIVTCIGCFMFTLAVWNEITFRIW
jgi:MFS family permease